jgi:polysaccharide biosynthesis protein PslG
MRSGTEASITGIAVLKRLAPILKPNHPKSYIAACGLLATLALAAFLYFACRAGLPGHSPRNSPLLLGTNAVLYDAQDADLISSLGRPGRVSARVTYYWSDIEPTEGNWQFAVYDDLVKRATNDDIPLLGILAYSMKRVSVAAADLQGDPWALSFCPPDDIEQFASFAGMVAARYPQVQYWEVWNEPNTTYFWRPSPDPARYVQLLKLSYNAIKAANPKAVVVLGGLSPGTGNGQVNTTLASSFLESVYQDGGKNYFDAVGFHPYNDGASPDSYLADYVNSVHDVMTRNQDGDKRVWITEIGWFVGAGANALSDAQQADYLGRAFTILNNLNFVQRVYWYNLKDYSNPATPVTPSPATACGPAVGNPVDYGLFRYAGSPRPAADAFKKDVQQNEVSQAGWRPD